MKVSSHSLRRQSLAKTLVSGDFPKVEKDVEQFPEPVLDLMDRYGIQVGILAPGETLADTQALRHLSEREYSSEISEAKTVFRESLKTAQANTILELAEHCTRALRKEGLEFQLATCHRDATPDEIADQQEIPSKHRDHWLQAFHSLNEGIPPGFYILPHHYHEGEIVPANRIKRSEELTADFLHRFMGINRPEERLVALHQDFVGENPKEIGNYSLAIHELGHALDHILDRVTGFPGLGSAHRLTVDALYQKDLKRAESLGGDQVFTSGRADDNVREYFAEAIEAYLTTPGKPEGEVFRVDNNRSTLKARSPELFDYIEGLMIADYSDVPAPKAPGRPLPPEGFPDPETHVVTIF